MSKKILALILALLMISAVACDKAEDKKPDGETPGEQNGEKVNENIELQSGEVVFRGKVTNVSDTRHIEMEIIESDIAFGTYWVIVGDPTELYGKDGEKIDRSDIKIGDTIDVVFGGQVMQSYPPQISAKRIYLL